MDQRMKTSNLSSFSADFSWEGDFTYLSSDKFALKAKILVICGITSPFKRKIQVLSEKFALWAKNLPSERKNRVLSGKFGYKSDFIHLLSDKLAEKARNIVICEVKFPFKAKIRVLSEKIAVYAENWLLERFYSLFKQ